MNVDDDNYNTLELHIPWWFDDVVCGIGGEAPKAGFTVMKVGDTGFD